jgi:23S rRNA pseudouridine1911/1915/1917 synthase
MLKNDEILYEDNHLLAVHKRAGVLVQGDVTGDVALFQMAQDYLRRTYQKPGNVYLGLVHRIDRPVAGVVLFAKTSKAASRLSKMFHDKEVTKTYLAVVERRPRADSGSLRHYLTKDSRDNVVEAFDAPGEGRKAAELRYELLTEARGLFLLRVNPLTGRPHQIRAQLSAMGCPILGDSKYGARRHLLAPDPETGRMERSIALLARRIDLEHPVKKGPFTVRSLWPEGEAWAPFSSWVASFEKAEGN